MELKEFITQTLLNITQGVDDANKETNRFQLSQDFHSGKKISGAQVEFEVGVVVKDSSTEGEKAGINVKLASLFGAGADVNTESVNANQSTHHLKFKVFIAEKATI